MKKETLSTNIKELQQCGLKANLKSWAKKAKTDEGHGMKVKAKTTHKDSQHLRELPFKPYLKRTGLSFSDHNRNFLQKSNPSFLG